jgi:hypothetical protein
MSTVRVVNVIPNNHSDEQNQDSEPSIAVNPNNPSDIVITAFTPPDNGQAGGPFFFSSDGGNTWFLDFDVPGGEPGDQSIGYGTVSNELYSGVLRGDIFKQLAVSRTANPNAAGVLPALDPRTNVDQPWVETRTVIGGPDDGKDRLYVGYNNDNVGVGNPSATVDVCLDALAGGPVFTQNLLETRAVGANVNDGYAIRPVAHYDGTVYVAYEGWRAGNFGANITTDIVVARDDNWGQNGFTDLKDTPGDGKDGRIVQTGVVIDDGGILGQERLNNDLAIAVDPTNSAIVYIAWADNTNMVYRLRVRRSLDHGKTWSGDLFTVDNATMACLAINVHGKVGLMYQQVNGGNWETHFRRTTDSSGMNWDDLTLSIAPANQPPTQGQPYLGDWARIVAVGKDFYGVFCANNTPDPANFPATPPTMATPNGAVFQRNVTTTAPWKLLGNDGVTQKSISIDPFFFYVSDVPPASDFYVRDWTNTPTDHDSGSEPSTNADFWDTSDVWNQYSSNVAFAPNGNDQIIGEKASTGAGSGAVNYAFARMRRNQLPAMGSGPVTVQAHFLVSEFGTGSNFSDWVFADPSDPDVTFPSQADVSVNFNDTDLGPFITPPFQWNLGPTASDHLCLAVEISAPGDPFAPPGLTGRAPGWPVTDISIVNDNNKAQRNLQVYVSGHGSHGSTYYAVAHNAALYTRDMVLEVAMPRDAQIPGRAVIEIVSEKGITERRPWVAWDKVRLTGMRPGENRWVGFTIPVPEGSETPIQVTMNELNGNVRVNGFSIAAQPAAIADVTAANLAFHQSVFGRMGAAFKVAAASSEVNAIRSFLHEGEKATVKDDVGKLCFEQNVAVTAKSFKIEVQLRISGKIEEVEGLAELALPSKPSITFETFLRSRLSNLRRCLSELLKATASTDAFAISETISAIEAISKGDEIALLTDHATLLHKLDAFLTMLQKAQGDRADILQVVLWQMDLYARSSVLQGLPDALAITQRSQKYVDLVTARTARIGDYAALLVDLLPAFGRAANALSGSVAGLQALVNNMGQATSARARQKAHHNFLLALQAVA